MINRTPSGTSMCVTMPILSAWLLLPRTTAKMAIQQSGLPISVLTTTNSGTGSQPGPGVKIPLPPQTMRAGAPSRLAAGTVIFLPLAMRAVSSAPALRCRSPKLPLDTRSPFPSPKQPPGRKVRGLNLSKRLVVKSDVKREIMASSSPKIGPFARFPLTFFPQNATMK